MNSRLYEDDAPGHGIDREDLEDLCREVFRIREGQRLRVEDARAPVARERRQVAAQEGEHMVGSPLEDPEIQD
jgi:hypothetical protein